MGELLLSRFSYTRFYSVLPVHHWYEPHIERLVQGEISRELPLLAEDYPGSRSGDHQHRQEETDFYPAIFHLGTQIEPNQSHE